MEYKIQHQSGLFIVRGPIPLAESECLGRFWQASLIDPVTDWQLAEALTASMVVGSRDACNAQRILLGLPQLTSPCSSNQSLARNTEAQTLTMAR